MTEQQVFPADLAAIEPATDRQLAPDSPHTPAAENIALQVEHQQTREYQHLLDQYQRLMTDYKQLQLENSALRTENSALRSENATLHASHPNQLAEPRPVQTSVSSQFGTQQTSRRKLTNALQTEQTNMFSFVLDEDQSNMPMPSDLEPDHKGATNGTQPDSAVIRNLDAIIGDLRAAYALIDSDPVAARQACDARDWATEVRRVLARLKTNAAIAAVGRHYSVHLPRHQREDMLERIVAFLVDSVTTSLGIRTFRSHDE